ncbi:hypothetical protein [Achromobacter sp. ESBL13]|uniref:hypothetical protein n=1 Tax=Achromobacter sp. ESBL13 TaxID=3077328 RepID=UPI002FC786C3
MLIYPASESFEKSKRERFSDAHPYIAETHVNLSGKDLWIDTTPYATTSSGAGPRMPFAAAESQQFMVFNRYPSPAATQPFPYDGARLREDIAQYRYLSASGDAVAASLPLTRLAYPDVARFSSALNKPDRSMLRYLYFHYPDRVEVAPALNRLAGMTEQRLDRQGQHGLVLLSAVNYTTGAIARLEVNGQTVDIGDRALVSVAPLPAACHEFAQPIGAAFIMLSRPLALRWQTTGAVDAAGAAAMAAGTITPAGDIGATGAPEAPVAPGTPETPKPPGTPGTPDTPEPSSTANAAHPWHTATLHAPAFRHPEPVDGESTLMRLQLYFLPDGTVEVERFVQVHMPKDKLGIRATGIPARAAPYASCGGAYNTYNPQTVPLLAN